MAPFKQDEIQSIQAVNKFNFLAGYNFNLLPIKLFSCQILALVFSLLMYCQILCAEKHLDWLQTSCPLACDGKVYHGDLSQGYKFLSRYCKKTALPS